MKASFRSPLYMALTNDKNSGRWKLMEPLAYFSAILGLVTVPKGFVTDLASVPRLPLAYLLAGDTAHRPAVVHDYLYSCRDVGRSKADAVFLEAMEVVGVPWWRRRMMWAAVRSFGWSCRKPSRVFATAAALLALCGCMTIQITVEGEGNQVDVRTEKAVSTDASIPANLIP